MKFLDVLQKFLRQEEVAKETRDNMRISAEALELEAKAKAKEIIVEAKDTALKIREKAQTEARKIKEDATDLERKLEVKKAQIDAKEQELIEKVRDLKNAKVSFDTEKERIEQMSSQKKKELERIAGMTREEAKNELLKEFECELINEKGRRIKELEEEIRRDSDNLAKEVIVNAMKYGATDYVVEYSTSKVRLEDDEMKGRIIGKEGRNIRTFEELTGVDLDLDSSPGEIIISCFDSVRREVARVALERLIADGRIQPARIEEVVNKAHEDIEKIMFKEGDTLCHKVGAYGVPKELVQELGKFKYRFSYGQNMIEHTLEVTRIGIALARELGVDIEVVRMGCLYHDIGKVVVDSNGSHVDLGLDILGKYGVSDKVIACVREHHEDNQSTIESAIVALADHISGSRPGSRGEDYESYIKRLKDMEEIATSFDGVDKAFAVSAGREVRVFVNPERVDDYATQLLAREIAKKIELEQSYPGTVKVIVIRETRVTETAK
ncbi:ribonuclease Y [Patescibacteria group bacterium]|nr:ribonuclease Y [Patescibacteria group bacterium]